MRPIALDANQPADRFYRGGERIARFRHATEVQPFTPEDWVASTIPLFGEQRLGLTALPDGALLVDRIEADPVSWLGEEHVARYGSDPALLVKLLDAGERLPVHVHPDTGFGARHLGLAHGKAEAWVMLEPATVYLGFSRPVSAEEVAGWVDGQDIDAMLRAMNIVEVQAGDTVFVPPGLPHAIGAGAFLVEVQEPTDLSILLEWRDFAIDGSVDGHLGLGFATSLDAVDRSAWDVARLRGLVSGADAPDAADGSVLPGGTEGFFRVERHRVEGSAVLDAGYGVLIATAGEGSLSSASGAWDALPLRSGDTVLTSHAAGALGVEGTITVLRCRPPAA